MKRLITASRAVVYAPLSSWSLSLVCGVLRSLKWLPAQAGKVGPIRRILVMQPHNSLGDLVLSLPFLAEVHQLWPDAEVDLVVGNAMTPMFQGIPFVNRVVGYTPTEWRPPFKRYHHAVRLALLVHRYLSGPYDLAVDPRWDSDIYGYLARVGGFFSGAAQRGAYSGTVDGKDPSLDGFLTVAAKGGWHEHELLRKLRLFERIGLSSRHVEDSAALDQSQIVVENAARAQDRALKVLQDAGLGPGERYGVLAPSASAANRIWPVGSLSELAQKLSSKAGIRFFAVGTAQDVPLCEHLAAMNPGMIASLAGKTGVLELFGVLGGAEIFIGNDSGPAHISGLLGRNTVVVSPYPTELNGLDHMNAPNRFRPAGPRVRVAQPQRSLDPCYEFCGFSEAHCVTQVSVPQVLMHCLQLLAVAPSSTESAVERAKHGG